MCDTLSRSASQSDLTELRNWIKQIRLGKSMRYSGFLPNHARSEPETEHYSSPNNKLVQAKKFKAVIIMQYPLVNY